MPHPLFLSFQKVKMQHGCSVEHPKRQTSRPLAGAWELGALPKTPPMEQVLGLGHTTFRRISTSSQLVHCPFSAALGCITDSIFLRGRILFAWQQTPFFIARFFHVYYRYMQHLASILPPEVSPDTSCTDFPFVS